LADGRFSIQAFLVPLLQRPKVAQFVKWAVYIGLIINFIAFIVDDYQVFVAALADDAPLAAVLETWSTSIDMAAWVALVFLFELETYALPEDAFKPWLTRTLHVGRIICYASLLLAAYSYTTDAMDNHRATPWTGVDSLCDVADQDISMMINSIDVERVTAENCSELSSDTEFFHLPDATSIIDRTTLDHKARIDWVGVINAFVWLIVVVLIEIELRLQNAGRFGDRTIRVVRGVNTFMYAILIAAGATWLVFGYPLWAWDAFLWIAGFWAIELNMVSWEKEELETRGDIANAPT
jgi:hypothetical protein